MEFLKQFKINKTQKNYQKKKMFCSFVVWSFVVAFIKLMCYNIKNKEEQKFEMKSNLVLFSERNVTKSTKNIGSGKHIYIYIIHKCI